jgi:hypothetical protein
MVKSWPQAKLRELLPDRMLIAHPELYVGDPEEESSVGALAFSKGMEVEDRSHKQAVGGPTQLLERRSFKRSPRGPVAALKPRGQLGAMFSIARELYRSHKRVRVPVGNPSRRCTRTSSGTAA